jgi:SEC-C motif domain protein
MMCPCYSGKEYAECCKPYHDGAPAPTPLALMRSRYSGYAMKKVDYIIETTHSNLRATLKSREAIEQFSNETQFTGLDILDHNEHEVTFRAHLTQGGKDVSFTEKSHFEKDSGRWKYHSGTILE